MGKRGEVSLVSRLLDLDARLVLESLSAELLELRVSVQSGKAPASISSPMSRHANEGSIASTITPKGSGATTPKHSIARRD